MPKGPVIAGSHRRLLSFPFTTATIALAVLVVIAAMTMDINFIHVNLGAIQGLEGSELDEVVTSWALVLVVFGVDQARAARTRRREDGLHAEQVRVVQVTMRTVQDIVGNCLTELQLLRMHAEGVVPAEALSIFDESIRVTTERLGQLGEMKTFAEKEMALGPGLHVEAWSSAHRHAA